MTKFVGKARMSDPERKFGKWRQTVIRFCLRSNPRRYARYNGKRKQWPGTRIGRYRHGFGAKKLIHNRMVAGRLYSRVVMRLPVELAVRVSALERARAITRQIEAGTP